MIANATDDIEEAPHRRAIERNYRVVDAAEAIAADHGATVPQVAIAWLMGVEGVTAPLVGRADARSTSRTCSARSTLELSAEERARLEAPAPPPADHAAPDAVRADRARAAHGAAALSSRSRSLSSFQAPTEARR